jgi:fatty acyl-CoA reductase
VGQAGLGLSDEDRAMLCRRVSLVFHSAATVRFDDPIRTAVTLNTGGTYKMIKLAEQMPNLLVRIVTFA